MLFFVANVHYGNLSCACVRVKYHILASTDCPGYTSVGLRFRERLGEYRSGAKLQRYSPAERAGLEVLMRSAQNAVCNHAFRLSTADEFFFHLTMSS
jgi:hypothetical protein